MMAGWSTVAELRAQAAGTRSWLWDGVLRSTGVTYLVGEAGIGKSRLTAALLVAASEGGCEIAGRAVTRTKVAVIAAEHDTGDAMATIDAAANGLGGDADAIPVRRSFNLDDPAQVDALMADLDAHDIGLLVVDPVRAVTAIDESSAGQCRAFGDTLHRIAGGRRLVLAIHHAGHSDGGKPRARGSSDFKAHADAMLIMRARAAGAVELSVESHGAAPLTLSLRFRYDEQGRMTVESVGRSQDEPASTVAEEREDVAGAIIAAVIAEPGIRTRTLREAVKRHGATAKGQTVDQVRTQLATDGKIENRRDKAGDRWHIVSVA